MTVPPSVLDAEERDRQHVQAGGTLCASCGLQLREAGLCPHHAFVNGDDWAEGNRIVCDFVHRGVVPGRLAEGERFLGAV